MASKKMRLREVISWQSKSSYLMWRAGLFGRRAKQIQLVTGEKLILRPPPTTDLGNAMEVFLFETYRSPTSLPNVRHIVDLGANIGCSVVYFASRYPEATISAFEPHPVHLRQLEANIAVNRLQARVTVYPCAAGVRDEFLFLTDAYTQSQVVRNPENGSLQVPVMDWFRLVAQNRIDLLKMDIEGGEHDLILDARFADVDIPRIVLEWHCRPDRPNADLELFRWLEELGYRLHHGPQGKLPDCRFGTVWAFR